jgi:hypothetical protein
MSAVRTRQPGKTRLTFCSGNMMRAQIEPNNQIFLDDAFAVDELW